jgi:hypothetical protein
VTLLVPEPPLAAVDGPNASSAMIFPARLSPSHNDQNCSKARGRPLLGSAKGMLARLLASSGKKVEAQEELTQAIALSTSAF